MKEILIEVFVMKKPVTLFFILLIPSFMMNSCNPSVRPTEVFDILTDVTPIYFPPPTSKPTLIPHDAAYVDWLNSIPDICNDDLTKEPNYDTSLSPDGLKAIAYLFPFILGTDHIELSYMENPEIKISIPIDSNSLGLNPSNIEDLLLYSGDWSPDSTQFTLYSLAFSTTELAFVLIVDISNPEDIIKKVVRWDFERIPEIYWSPDSSRLLLWFGEPIDKMSIDGETQIAWIVDLNGQLIKEFDVHGMKSPLWTEDSLFLIKDDIEIWRYDFDGNHREKVFSFDHLFGKLLASNKENTQLLLIDNNPPYDFLIFDIVSKTVVKRVQNPMKFYSARHISSATNVQTTLDITGIKNSGEFYIYDWRTQVASKPNGRYWILWPTLWSPVVNGFMVCSISTHKIEIIYPD